MERKIDYWDCDDSTERLYYEDKDDAIESHLDGLEDVYENGEEIEVHGYSRMTVDPVRFQKAILEYAYEYLSEDYDGEDGHEQNKEIEDSATAFVRTYLDNYTVWGCDLVKTEKVNVKEWVAKNRPDWNEGTISRLAV